MVIYRDMPMSERIDKLAELLANGVYLYIQKQKEEANKQKNEEENNKIASNEDPC